jgi:hypothetical protein
VCVLAAGIGCTHFEVCVLAAGIGCTHFEVCVLAAGIGCSFYIDNSVTFHIFIILSKLL